jgi:hypothetical protein
VLRLCTTLVAKKEGVNLQITNKTFPHSVMIEGWLVGVIKKSTLNRKGE